MKTEAEIRARKAALIAKLEFIRQLNVSGVSVVITDLTWIELELQTIRWVLGE